MKASISKRFLSMLLVLLLALSLTVPALAANYTDIDNTYWAKSYIDELSRLGFFSGYEDGSFRPNGQITFCETLVLLSRFFDVDETTRAYIDADYADFVKDTVPSNLSWAKNELTVCLAAGIISKNELSRVNLSAPINKQTMALFLVRAIGLRDNIPNAMSMPLPFEDTDQLISDYRGSVAILFDAGIVTGDDQNRFNPTQTVTRAVAAAMLSRTLSFIKEAGLNIGIAAYQGLDEISGLLSSVGVDRIQLTMENGLVRELPINSSTKTTLNGISAVLNSDCIGAYAALSLKDGVVTTVKLSAANALGEGYYGGIVQSVSTSGSGIVTIQFTGSSVSSRYSLVTGTEITRNGVAALLKDVQRGDFAIVYIKSGLILELKASAGTVQVTGTISALNYGTTVELRLTDKDGAVWFFPMSISDLPDVYQGNLPLSFDRLAVGDAVSVEVVNGLPDRIMASGSEDRLVGTITSIVDSVSGTYWELTDDKGEAKLYSVADNATAYSGKNSILLSSIKVGDRVSVSLFNSVITSVVVDKVSTNSQVGKISGTVLNVDVNARQIILLVNEKLYYVNVPGRANLIYALTGNSLGLVDLTPDSTLVVYGNYESSTQINATLLVVEALADE